MRAETKPDDWERSALTAFEGGKEEVVEFSEIEGVPYLRLMQAMVTTERCLKCHAHQGYEEGDVRGGVSISVPMVPYLANIRRQFATHAASFAVLWLVGFLDIGLATSGLRNRIKERDRAEAELREAHDKPESRVKERTAALADSNRQLKHEIEVRKSAEKGREETIAELQDAPAKVKTLSGMLPICASCKKVRDDKGYWNQIERYIKDRSEAEFSHSICPDCAKKLYPDLEIDKDQG